MRFSHAIIISIMLPICVFLIAGYPDTARKVNQSDTRLTGYYLLKQLDSEINSALTKNDGLPPRYTRIIRDYRPIVDKFGPTDAIAPATVRESLNHSQRVLARVLLWFRDSPWDLLEVDPLREIKGRLSALQKDEQAAEIKRERLLNRHKLQCLRFRLPDSSEFVGKFRSLPKHTLKKGLSFCNERIPLNRPDVRRRIERQLEYLLTDFRDNTTIWLIRKDRLSKMVGKALSEEGAPRELLLLPMLESSYTAWARSHKNAVGWWQFRKPTATQCLSSDPELDWTLIVNERIDERMDLTKSTRSAARFLKWLRLQTTMDGKSSWLNAAAAYNAGPALVRNRMKTYGTPSYWDIKLPTETEEYVPRWIALYLIDANRDFYGIAPGAITPLEYETLEGVVLTRQLPLTFLAAITESPLSLIRNINAGLRRNRSAFAKGAGPRGKGNTIHLPKGCSRITLSALAAHGYIN
jgi:membrane-bound lytic murein transglycosylase D